jgi:hypothetical protein
MLDPEDDFSAFSFDETDVLLPASSTPGQDKGAPTLSPPDSVGAGLHFNLIAEASVANAPSWFVPSIQAAANLLQQTFSDNITLNISYGWGTIGGSSITNANTALGGAYGFNIGYSTVKSWLSADAKSADDASAVASSPNSSSAFPSSRAAFGVSTAQEKALGHFTGDPTALDGEIGFGTGWTQGTIVGAALHELTHAMGRVSGWSLDLFRYSAPGTYQFALGQAAYFSINGGTTHLANFGRTSDTGDWLTNGSSSAPLTTNDPFNEFINSSSNALTAVDITVMDVLGFDRAGSTAPQDDIASNLVDTTAPLAHVAVNGVANGTLEVTSDRDWFSVQLTAGWTYTINLEGGPTGAGTLSDPYLRFHDAAGALLAQNDDASAGNLNSQLTYVATATGTYYVEAGAFSDTGTGTYRVGVSATTPNHAPVITSGGGVDAATLVCPEYSAAVTVVTASDQDAGTILSYSLVGGADAARFQISAGGALSFITVPNFKQPTDVDHNNSYIVQVRVSDGSLFDDQTITVNVTDVPEGPSINAGVYTDLGGDHRADVFLHNQNGTVALWQMNGAQVQSAAVIGSVGTEWNVQSTADFNGDGRGDVLWRATDGKVMVWTMNGPQIQATQIVGSVGNEWHVQGTGDLDGDGIADLIWRNDAGTLMLWKMNGVQIQSVQFFGQVGNEWHIVGIGDFNGDGKSDILWRGDNGAVLDFQMNGTQIQSAQTIGSLGLEWHVEGVGDFNGDGRGDILWRNDDGSLLTTLMNGAQIQASAFPGTRTNDWHLYGTGDFNGDGKADILWRNDNGNVEEWQMNGSQVAATASITPLGADWALGVHHYDLV